MYQITDNSVKYIQPRHDASTDLYFIVLLESVIFLRLNRFSWLNRSHNLVLSTIEF